MSASAITREVERVVLAHGGGGERMQQLIREHVFPAIGNAVLARMTDGAELPAISGPIVMTTDSYVVSPLEFPGGDIGRLAVAGTVNDLAVMGARPIALTLGLILEEGLRLDVLDRVMASIAATARQAGISIVTGDTKVIERRRHDGVDGDPSDGLFINTAGIGEMRSAARLDVNRVQPGNAVLVSGRVAEHGLAVLSRRNGIAFDTDLKSDVAPLNHMIAALLESGADVRFVRDATRGGIAGVLADISESTGLSIDVEECRVPISPTARHAADLVGLDPLTVANEGKVVCVVAGEAVHSALAALRSCPEGSHAAWVGTVTDTQPPLVELLTLAGGRRIVQRPYGEELPRIC